MDQDEKITFVEGGYETENATGKLRFLGKTGTTTAPRILQQEFEVSRVESSGKLLSRRIEWRDVPLHLED